MQLTLSSQKMHMQGYFFLMNFSFFLSCFLVHLQNNTMFPFLALLLYYSTWLATQVAESLWGGLG